MESVQRGGVRVDGGGGRSTHTLLQQLSTAVLLRNGGCHGKCHIAGEGNERASERTNESERVNETSRLFCLLVKHTLRARFCGQLIDQLSFSQSIPPLTRLCFCVCLLSNVVQVEMVMPGDNARMVVELIQDSVVEKGMRFAIREGGRTVGAGVVTELVSKLGAASRVDFAKRAKEERKDGAAKAAPAAGAGAPAAAGATGGAAKGAAGGAKPAAATGAKDAKAAPAKDAKPAAAKPAAAAAKPAPKK